MSQEWVTEELSQLGVIKTGNTPKTSVKENFGDFIPFIKPANFNKDGSIDYEQDGLSELGSKSSRLIDKNSVLMVCIGATIGKTGFTNVDIACNQQINSFTPNDNLYPRFFYYAMVNQDFQRNVILKSGQATLPIINKSKWSQLKVSYPQNIDTQKLIVAKLDKAFADIEKAKVNAEQNLVNVKELFESYLQQVISENTDNEGVVSTLGDLGKITSSRRIFKKEYVDEGIPFYRTKEIKQLANHRDISTELFISEERYQEIKSNNGVPSVHDILLTAIGTIGEIYVVEDDSPFYFKDGNVLWLKDFSSVNSYFLKYALMAFVTELRRLSRGAAYNALPIQKLKSYKINVPPMEEQLQIVSKLDQLKSTANKLEQIYIDKISLLDELKQSILQKAFNGELA